MKSKFKLNMEVVILILAIVNIIYTASVFIFTRRSISSRITHFEESMRSRYDKMVCQIIADGLSNLHTSYTNEFSHLTFEHNLQSNNIPVIVDNSVDNENISLIEIDEPYQYFENCGVSTVKLRNKYYIEGETVKPFGVIEEISPYQIKFDGHYVINNYRKVAK